MYGKENFIKVKGIIENRRKTALETAEKRCERVRLMSEEIARIDKELEKTGLLIFKTACAGGDIEKIRDKNRKLMESRALELKKIGYPEDYTEPCFACEMCGDTGFLDTAMCSCMKELILKENILSSGMGNLMESQSFENFDINWYRDDAETYEKMKNNLEFAKHFAKNFSIPTSANILLMGKTGLGKTHITTSIARVIIEKGYEVLYDTAQNIFDAFENDKFRRSYANTELRGEKFLNCDLLIIDDLGTEFSSQFTVSCLYNILNTRQNKGLSTILSTNLSYKEFNAKYEDRIYSRLIGSNTNVLLFDGRDYRINKR